MILLSLELKNFRQFYGQQNITFSTDPQKNITLIHAENGVGKTALLNSILWCMYEKTTDNFEQKTKLINNQAKKEGEDRYHVYIGFEEEGERYNVQRSYDKISGKKFKIFKIKGNNNWEEIRQTTLFINTIVPNDMANYFFFQGEGISTITDEQSSYRIRDAIRNILGFTLADKAISDLNDILNEYRREYDRIDKGSELAKKNSQLADFTENQKKISKKERKSADTLSELQQEIERIEKSLAESNNEAVRQLQFRRNDKTELKREIEGHIRSLERRRIILLRKYIISVFGKSLTEEGLDFINEQELKGKIPAPYNEQLLYDIMKEMRCICGNEVKPGTEQYEKINKLLSKATNPVLLNRISRARSQLTLMRNDVKRVNEEFDSLLKELSETSGKLNEIEIELKNLSKEIEGINIEEISELEKKLNRYKGLHKEEYRLNINLARDQEEHQKDIARLHSEIQRMESTEPRVRWLNSIIVFTERCKNQLIETLTETEENARNMLLENINKILKEFVRQDYFAKLDDKYNIRLHDRSGDIVGKSDGQKLLLSLTFISSLIELAYIRKSAKSNILTPGAIAPFVIDAPFGVLDKTYKKNIASKIPELAKQVIFLLSSSHWEGEVDEAIKSKVGKEYNMVLEVAAIKKKKEEEYLLIHGKKYGVTRYGAKKDLTRIEEIGNYVD